MRKTQKKTKRWHLYQKWKTIDQDIREILTNRIPAAFVHGVLIAFWSAGIMAWLSENAGMAIAVRDLIPISLVLSLIYETAIFMEVFEILGVVFTGTLVFMAFAERSEVITGWHMWLDGLQNAISNYYQIDLQLTSRSVTDGRANMFFYIVIAFLVLLTDIVIVRWRTAWLTVLITGLSLVMSLLLDVFPEISVVIISVTACAGVWAFTAVGEIGDETPLTKKALKTGGLAAVLMACMIGIGYWLAQNYVMDDMNSRYESIKEYPQKMMALAERVIEGISSDPKGQLSNQPPAQTNRVQLKVWTDEKQSSGIYLKDFTGVHFNQKSEQWEAVTDKELETDYQKWAVSGQWSYDEAKGVLARQLYKCLEQLESEKIESNYIISNISEENHCTWAPYGVDLSGLEMEGDSCIKASSQNEFRGYAIPDIDMLLSDLPKDGVINQEEAALFQEYSRYVYDNYLDLPDQLPSLWQAVEKIQEDNGNLSLQQWVAEIQNVLWKECTYDKNHLEPVPDGSNVIEDFFGNQKKGYCIHFASAGVMMLRMAGIPARYAEGYVVWPDDFEKDDASNGYRADVTGYRGHAWVEVYDETYGIWIPVDMTPSDSVIAENALSPATEETVNTTASSETSTTEMTSTEMKESATETIESKTETEAVSSNETEEGVDHTKGEPDISENRSGHKIVWLLIPVLILIAIGLGRHLVMKQKPTLEKSRRRVSHNRAILSLWHQLTDDLDQIGIRPETELDDWRYIEWLASSLPTPDENELLFLMEKLHQAAYSDEMLTDEEYERCVQICQDIKKSVEKEN